MLREGEERLDTMLRATASTDPNAFIWELREMKWNTAALPAVELSDSGPVELGQGMDRTCLAPVWRPVMKPLTETRWVSSAHRQCIVSASSILQGRKSFLPFT